MRCPNYVETGDQYLSHAQQPVARLFELNLDKDQLGQVIVAAFGENTEIGSRVAVLGDGEFCKTATGCRSLPAGHAAFPANYIMTQRLAAWLLASARRSVSGAAVRMHLDRARRQYQRLADQRADHARRSRRTPSILSLNIQQVRAVPQRQLPVHEVETVSQANADAQIDLEFDTDWQRSGRYHSSRCARAASSRRLAISRRNAVPDAGMAIGDVIELRLPLRLTGMTPRMVSLCLSSGRELAFPQPPDCIDSPFRSADQLRPDPAPLRYSDYPIFAVRGDG